MPEKCDKDCGSTRIKLKANKCEIMATEIHYPGRVVLYPPKKAKWTIETLLVMTPCDGIVKILSAVHDCIALCPLYDVTNGPVMATEETNAQKQKSEEDLAPYFV